ncbi:MAG TPA: hypothetical protein PKE31_03040 [Pseudomonadota bacterium]|jgi:predicted Zn-dependent protease|nr:hypothetical protein [Pseudomonadota bacterium]
MRRFFFRSVLCATVLTAVIEVLSPSAEACGNVVSLSKNVASQLVARAEKALSQGKPAEAFDILDEKLRSHYGLRTEDPTLTRKLQLIYSVACIRSSDAKGMEYGTRSLKWAHESDPKNPIVAARLAEAISRLPAETPEKAEQNRKEALALLEPLAEKDLIVDADAFATLARLKKQKGDDGGAKEALARCAKMSKNPTVCSDAPWPSPAPDGTRTPSALRTRRFHPMDSGIDL